MVVRDTIETKRCSSCRQHLPMDGKYFSKDKSTKDGWNNYCKKCNNRKSRIRYHKSKAATKPRLVETVPCQRCVFRFECRDFIWELWFEPNCFTDSKHHDLFVQAYGKNGGGEK